MKIAGIVTARGGSKSIIKKNIIQINGVPLLHYPLLSLINSKHNISTYVNTDCSDIAYSASLLGVENIERPEKLAGDTINHGDAIIDACQKIIHQIGDVDIFIILLGNTVMIDSVIVDKCIDTLSSSDASSVITVWEAADDHPYRALKLSSDGYLSEFNKRNVCTDRHSYKKAYFFDQGVWAIKSEFVFDRTGPSPWYWLGPRVKPIIREWITGRDINGPFDVPFHELWDKLKITPKEFKY